jgi:hypothetical protein
MMIFGFLYLRYKAGCSIKVAAQHVWYDRFDSRLDDECDDLAPWLQIRNTIGTRSSEEQYSLQGLRSSESGQHHSGGTRPRMEEESDDTHSVHGNREGQDLMNADDTSDDESSSQTIPLIGPAMLTISPAESRFYPGSAIDRTWRYGIGAFFVGALPQVVKVFAMQGIPFTKIAISIFVVAFTVPEIFRVVAGLEDAKELHPLPVVSRANAKLQEWNCRVLGICVCVSLPPYYLSFQLNPRDGEPWSSGGNLFFTSFALGVAVSVLLKIIWMRARRVYALADHYEQFLQPRPFIERARRCYLKASAILAKAFPFYSTTYFHRKVGVTYIPITFLIYATFLSSSWDGGLLLLSSQDANVVLRLLNVFVLVFPQMFIMFLSPPIFITLFLSLSFELLLMGSMSGYLRRITGLNGSMSEFISGYMLLLTFYTYLLYYALPNDWDSAETYKPSWAEYLG